MCRISTALCTSQGSVYISGKTYLHHILSLTDFEHHVRWMVQSHTIQSKRFPSFLLECVCVGVVVYPEILR